MGVESKLQYLTIITSQTRTFDHISFARITDYCEKCRFTPGSDPTELWHSGWAHWMEFDKMKGMIKCNIFIHRICDIIRRSVVFAYHHF